MRSRGNLIGVARVWVVIWFQKRWFHYHGVEWRCCRQTRARLGYWGVRRSSEGSGRTHCLLICLIYGQTLSSEPGMRSVTFRASISICQMIDQRGSSSRSTWICPNAQAMIRLWPDNPSPCSSMFNWFPSAGLPEISNQDPTCIDWPLCYSTIFRGI